MPPDARLAFPFTSETAKYIFVSNYPEFPNWSYGDPPVKGDLAAIYSGVVDAWTTYCRSDLKLDTTAQDAAFGKALTVLKMWDGPSSPTTGGPVADSAAGAVYGALDAARQSVRKPDAKGIAIARQLMEASARVSESMIVSLETTSASHPNLVRALWRVAELCPYSPGPGIAGDVGDWWDGEVDKVRDALRSRGGNSLANTDIADAMAKARALTSAFRDLFPVLDSPAGREDDLASTLVALANTVEPLADAVRSGQVTTDVQQPLAKALGTALGEMWSRTAKTYAGVFEPASRAAVFRGPITLGSQRIAPGTMNPGTFYKPPDPNPDADPAVRLETMGGGTWGDR